MDDARRRKRQNTLHKYREDLLDPYVLFDVVHKHAPTHLDKQTNIPPYVQTHF